MADSAATALDMSNHLEATAGKVELYAQAATKASTQGSAVMAGRGWYQILVEVTAIEVDTDDEEYVVDIEANTADTTGTWYRIGTAYFDGAQERSMRSADGAVGTQLCAVYNPFDYQIRATVGVAGTVGTGINVGVWAIAMPALGR